MSSTHPAEAQVPAELLKPRIEAYMEKLRMSPSDFRDKHGVTGDALKKILAGEGLVRFDTADKVICSIGSPFVWHVDPDLHEVYRKIDLRWIDERGGTKVLTPYQTARRCAGQGCTEVFVPNKHASKDAKYHSPACRARTHKQQKHGLKTRARGPGRKLEAYSCVNGHERTPQNTYRNTRGALVCRICRSEALKRYRDKKAAA